MKQSIRIRNEISKINPLAIKRREKMRSALKNENISFFVPNCIGGILFHDLGLQFLSPTVNLMMFQKDFLHFILNLDEYLRSELLFFKHPEYSFPCAHIHPDDLPEITIHFTHYLSEEDAAAKWEARKQRINYDNMFVMLLERDGIQKEDIEKLACLKVKGLVVFTAHKYEDLPYTVYLPNYAFAGEVSGIHDRSWIDDSREYERYFDFVKWFNEADGKNFDVKRFAKQ